MIKGELWNLLPFFKDKGMHMIGFIGAKIAKYFNELDARNLLRTKWHILWSLTMIIKDEQRILIDNIHLSTSPFEYVTSFHSSYLTLRCENSYIVEPYNLHMFNGQFGYVQDVPKNLSEDIRSRTLKEIAN